MQVEGSPPSPPVMGSPGLGLTCQLVWLASDPHRSACLHVPGLGTLVPTFPHWAILTWVLGIKLGLCASEASSLPPELSLQLWARILK